MRVRLGVAMSLGGGRSAVVGAEVLEQRAADGRLEHRFEVGIVRRVSPFSVEACRDEVSALMAAAAQDRPCCIVDVGSPQGLALHQALRGAYPPDLHRPHAFPGVGQRTPLFAAFLQAYSAERVMFAPDLEHRADLDRALTFHLGKGVKRHGLELDSEDEALVVALGLALVWPKHGASARSFGALVTKVP